jgi:hypothetical protein
MSNTLLPFLYQTRTLQRAWRGMKLVTTARLVHSSRRQPTSKSSDEYAVPFDWGDEAPPEDAHGASNAPSTITPSEANIFKGIFDEIAQGKMVPSKKRPADLRPGVEQDGAPRGSSGVEQQHTRSIVEQARVAAFREKVLQRYPESLRNAAQVALGLFELEPGSDDGAMMPVDEDYEGRLAERVKYERIRAEERTRVETLMNECETDFALWAVMEKEVFSLPEKLGILQPLAAGTRTVKRATKRGTPAEVAPEAAAGENKDDERRIMDVHGPLYSHFLSYGLKLLNSAFAQPSLLVFEILPRVRALGLPSYVLGVSTPFYTALAQIHWHRFGDASSALDMIQEMTATGLSADEQVYGFLLTMRDHLHGCTWGVQGPFVAAMMESPPYDGALLQRLDDVVRATEDALEQQDDAQDV